ncbi:hypothetical protein DNA98_13045 [Meiothermus sp. Pnk-1]|nr:hypothetical protein DNA98_13045 [Meiothermus sp. Pnk-1]
MEVALELRKMGYIAQYSEIVRAILDLARDVYGGKKGERDELLRYIGRASRRDHGRLGVYLDPEDDALLLELKIHQARQGERKNLSDIMEGILDWFEAKRQEEGFWERFLEKLLTAIPDEDGRGKRTKTLV